MAESSWYYTQGGHRVGPVPLGELQSLVASTRVNGQELAWTAGMQDWARVIDLPILRDPGFKRTALADQKPSSSENGDDFDLRLAPATEEMPAPPYVVPRTSLYGPVLLPPRPAATFVNHAEPRGDASDWPVSDEKLVQFEITGELRRHITAAAGLYWILSILTMICGVALLVVAICLFVLVARKDN